jgi:hypothetical protein
MGCRNLRFASPLRVHDALTKVVERVELHAGQSSRCRVDVPRNGEVDHEQRRGADRPVQDGSS